VNRFADALYSIAVTLWVGGLWAIGYIAAPTLFAELSDRAVAGQLAGAMFTWIAWVGFACGGYALIFLAARHGWRVLQKAAFWLVLAMLLLAAAGHFGTQPIMARLKADALPRQVMETVLRDRFALWHGVSSGLYLVQSLLGAALVLVSRKRER